MLPPFIIEQIRRREEAQREEARRKNAKQPRLELPLDIYEPAPDSDGADEERQRGVLIVDI